MRVALVIRPFSIDSMVATLAVWHIPASSPLMMSNRDPAGYPSRSTKVGSAPSAKAHGIQNRTNHRFSMPTGYRTRQPSNSRNLPVSPWASTAGRG